MAGEEEEEDWRERKKREKREKIGVKSSAFHLFFFFSFWAQAMSQLCPVVSVIFQKIKKV